MKTLIKKCLFPAISFLVVILLDMTRGKLPKVHVVQETVESVGPLEGASQNVRNSSGSAVPTGGIQSSHVRGLGSLGYVGE